MTMSHGEKTVFAFVAMSLKSGKTGQVYQFRQKKMNSSFT